MREWAVNGGGRPAYAEASAAKRWQEAGGRRQGLYEGAVSSERSKARTTLLFTEY
jgi:hypothetical protein